MSFRFLPEKLANRIAPQKLIKKLVTQDLTLNRTVLTQLSRSGVLSRKALERIALRVIKGYKARYEDEREDGLSKADALEEAVNGKALMIQRVQDSIVFEIAQDLKDEYRGEFYKWLPSSAEEPDPLHQLNYGKTFQLGKGDANGEDPGDRWGCKCGMELLVEETKLTL